MEPACNITSHTLKGKYHLNLFLGYFCLVSFLVGILVNGTLLWLLWRKLERTVNSLLVFHLSLSFMISCCTLPFFGVSYTKNLDWPFESAMCKFSNFALTLGTVATTFLLTTISLDRYFLICHPIWTKHHRTIPWAWRLITGIWLISVAFSTPQLVFFDSHKQADNMTYCVTNYTRWFSKKGACDIHLAFFVSWLVMMFLLPFFIIMGCYYRVSQEMKKKRLVKTRKPFKVLITAVMSFFIFKFPFYLYGTLDQFNVRSEQIFVISWVLFSIGLCLNISFTPILYVFVVEKFQQVFKMSIIVAFKKDCLELRITSRLNCSSGQEDSQTNDNNSLDILSIPENNLPSS